MMMMAWLRLNPAAIPIKRPALYLLSLQQPDQQKEDSKNGVILTNWMRLG